MIQNIIKCRIEPITLNAIGRGQVRCLHAYTKQTQIKPRFRTRIRRFHKVLSDVGFEPTSLSTAKSDMAIAETTRPTEQSVYILLILNKSILIISAHSYKVQLFLV